MDILTFIDKFNQNFDKQPEPRYNTKKYFIGTDNVDDIGPGSSNRGKLPRLDVMPEDYYSEGRGTGVMIDPRGFKDGKLQIPTQGLDDGGRVGFKNGKKVRPSGLDSTRSKTGLDRMSDLLLKAYAEDDILHLANMPKRDTMNLSYFLAREDNIKYLSKKSGLSTEDIFDLLDDREAYLELEKRNISQTAGAETRFKPQREFYRKAEDWITKNAKRYDDPEKFKKAFKRTFPKNNLLLDAINSNKESLNVQFSDSFKSEMFGTGEGLTLGGRSKKQVEVTSKIKDLSIPRRSVDAVFKTAIYNLNPTVRNKLLNEFKNIVPKNKPSNKDLYNIKQSIRNNKLFKKFGVEKSIKGPIARLLYKDLGDNLSKQISALRQPRLQTTSLLRVFRDLVDPKYKNQFTEALSAIESANKKDIPEAKAKLNIAENINFDHKIPKSFIDAGYADEINYIKLNPTLESFNQGAKLNEFDRPMLALSRKYEAASKQEKPKILNKMKDLQSNFNKKYDNYLSSVSIKDVKGKPYFKSTDLPLSKKTNIAKGLSKILECKLEKGVNCDDPMSYYKSLKEQEEIAAKGKGPNKIKAINKVKAAKNFIYGTLGPYALALEAAIAAPIAGYQASKGALPSEILNTATYGLAGKDRDELIQEQSGKEIFKARDFLETGEKLDALRKDPIYGGYRGKADRIGALEDTSKKFRDQYQDSYFTDPMTGRPSTEIFSIRQQQQADAEAQDQKGRDQRAKEFADKYTDTSSGLELFASGGLANLTRTIPPEKGPQSQGLASFMKNGKR